MIIFPLQIPTGYLPGTYRTSPLSVPYVIACVPFNDPGLKPEGTPATVKTMRSSQEALRTA
jgi:hypothetical protein